MPKFRALPAAVSLAVAVILALSLALTACDKEKLVYLDQGWTEEERQFYYTASQGSALIPYNFFLHLEQASGQELFRSDANLARFGFLLNPAGEPHNPDGLPVGLVLADVQQGPWAGQWMGLTCAACHTGQFEYQGARIRIDGGQTMTDVWAFMSELGAALDATSQQPDKFDRFARNALGDQYNAEAAGTLAEALEVTRREIMVWLEMMDHPVPWGPGRVDAAAGIFNLATAARLGIPENRIVAAAGENAPFLWTTPEQSWVQWQGSAHQPLTRNVTEVMGVFARYDLHASFPETGLFQSTVDLTNLHLLEESLRQLTPPPWPQDIFGKVDSELAGRGEALFQEYCQSCHTVEPYRLTPPNQHGRRFIDIEMTPLDVIGTDPTLINETLSTTVDPGSMAGFMPEPFQGLPRVPALIAVAVIEGGLTARAFAELNLSDAEKLEYLDHRPLPFDPGSPQPPNLMAYKSGPMEGVWATAPFLHNGSVPSVYQLLLPVDQRVKKFCVNLEYDPVDMGIDTTPRDGCFELDTSLQGNSNSGHAFQDGPSGNGIIGPLLTEEERRALIEYLKVLPAPK